MRSALRTIFVVHKKTFFVLLFLTLYSVTITYAVPPATPYNPGESLDPNCAPGDTNCSVQIIPDQTGNAGEFLTTDGSTTSWSSIAGEATTASNGLTLSGHDVRLGGTLTSNTSISGNDNYSFGISNVAGAISLQTAFNGGSNSSIQASWAGEVYLNAQTATQSNNIILSPALDLISVQGSANFKGLTYNADYSANYTSRSIIDKGYADSAYWKNTGTSTLTGPVTISRNTTNTLDFSLDDSSVNSVLTVARLNRTTSGTALAGIGTGLDFGIENGSGITRYGSIQYKYLDPTNTTEGSEFVFNTYIAGTSTKLAELGYVTGGSTGMVLNGPAATTLSIKVNDTDAVSIRNITGRMESDTIVGYLFRSGGSELFRAGAGGATGQVEFNQSKANNYKSTFYSGNTDLSVNTYESYGGYTVAGASAIFTSEGDNRSAVGIVVADNLSTGLSVTNQTGSGTFNNNYNGHLVDIAFLGPSQTMTTNNTKSMLRLSKQYTTLSGFDHTGAFIEMLNQSAFTGDFIKATDGASTTYFEVKSDGDTGIGVAPSYRLDVKDDSASVYVASFFNDGNNDNRWGIQIQAGADTPSGGKWIQFNDGDGGDVGSICYSGGQANICSPSDMNLKKNITTLLDDSSWSLRSNITNVDDTVLDKILSITPVIYNWNTEEDGSTRHAGFIAQEIEQVFPDLVHTNENGLKSINYTALMPYAIESIQELHTEIKNLEDLSNVDNTFRTSLISWLADVNNGVGEIFAKKLKAEELCLRDNTGSETCITKSQVDSILDLLNSSGQANTSTPTDVLEEPIAEIVPDENTVLETPVVEESVLPIETTPEIADPTVTE